MDFLSNLDNLEVDDAPGEAAVSGSSVPNTASAPTASTASPAVAAVASASTPRASGELPRPSNDSGSRKTPVPPAEQAAQDEEAASALAFLEAQIAQKRAPLSVPQTTSRPLTPSAPAASSSSSTLPPGEPANIPSQPAAAAGGGGWGSWWSTASSVVQSAQKMADEQYKKVRTEGVSGVTHQLDGLQVGGVDLGKLRKQAEERLGGIVQGVDLDKLRHDLLNNTTSALTTILNTVAPPISAHETLELWLTHPMVGYAGVEGVVYRAWMRVLEQTESGEIVVVWSPPHGVDKGESEGEKRGMNPVDGWEAAKESADREIEAVKGREDMNPKGRKSSEENPNVPVTTVPIFLHIQPLLVTLPYAEPSVLLSAPAATEPPKHLYFLMTLQDPAHSLQFTTATQAVPSDWLDVEYDQSEWVEERLVDVLKTGVEVLAQDYVATRMGLKPSTKTRPPSPKHEGDDNTPKPQTSPVVPSAAGPASGDDKKD